MTVNEDSFTSWKNREEIAESMIPIIGKLHRERDVTILLHSRSLVNKSVVSILKTHRFARQIDGEELSVTETLPFLQVLTTLDLGPSQIDIGMLAAEYKSDDRGLSVAEFTAESVAGATGTNKIERSEGRDVVLYGFGRIGRLVARLLIEKAYPATACGCAPSSSARAATRTSSSAPPCCAATRSTASSRARSPSTRRTARSSPTATPSR